MNFESLKDKCLYYRGLTDYRLMPNSYVICMLDGRAFSKMIKNKFKKPFDSKFINAMNETARYLCENVQGCKFGYVQSDEISLLIYDVSENTNATSSFFGYRLCKIQSICASMAAAKFNQIMLDYRVGNVESESGCAGETIDDCRQAIMSSPLYEFDCKAWNVPNENDAYAWFLYRQLDCIRNAKQAVAQSVCSNRELTKKNTDEQIALALEKGCDFNSFKDGEKYGRVIERKEEKMTTIVKGKEVEYVRNPFKVFDAKQFNDEEYAMHIRQLIKPIKDSEQ